MGKKDEYRELSILQENILCFSDEQVKENHILKLTIIPLGPISIQYICGTCLLYPPKGRAQRTQ